MWQRVLIVAGAEAIIVGVPAMMGADFLSANAHWVTALGVVALIMGAFWDTITNPIRSVVHQLMPAKSTYDRERDVIPLELRVWGTQTRDGVDIEPQIVYRNRSPIDLRVKPTSATYILDNKKPEGQASRGFSGDLKRESNSSVSFKPIRVYQHFQDVACLWSLDAIRLDKTKKGPPEKPSGPGDEALPNQSQDAT